jgi:endogenous inhibitor of DNA gyrase (YacG/DUF329 family)
MTSSKPETCPICGKPPSTQHKPFCGQGCRDRDLLQWLGEGYRIPGRAADPGDSAIGVDSAGDAD